MNDIQPRIKHLSPVRHTRIKHLYMNDIQPFSCHHWGILYVHPRKTYFTCSGTPLYTVLPVMSPTSTKNTKIPHSPPPYLSLIHTQYKLESSTN